MNNDKLTLSEAIAQLKKDGSNWAVCHSTPFRIRIVDGVCCFEEKKEITDIYKGWKSAGVYCLPLNDWQAWAA